MNTMRPPRLQRVEILREIVAAHHVEDDVTAPLAFGDLGEVFRAGVDSDVGAQRPRRGGLVGSPGGGDHLCAKGLAHLDGRRANPGCGAMQHQRLAGFQGAMFEHIGEYREHGLRQGGGLHEAQALGDRKCMACVANGVLGIAAAAQQRADLVTRLPAPRAHDHLAGHLQPHGLRRARRRRIETHALDDVRPVDPRCVHADQDLAFLRLRLGNRDGLQRFRRTLAALDGDRGHGLRHVDGSRKAVSSPFARTCAQAACGVG